MGKNKIKLVLEYLCLISMDLIMIFLSSRILNLDFKYFEIFIIFIVGLTLSIIFVYISKFFKKRKGYKHSKTSNKLESTYFNIQGNYVYIENLVNKNEVYVDGFNNIYIGSNLLLLDKEIVKALILHEISHIKHREIFIINIIKKYNFIELIFAVFIIFNNGFSLDTFSVIVLALIVKNITSIMVLKNISMRFEYRADMYVLSNGYKEELLQALRYYLDLYKPKDYSSEISENYYKLKKRYEHIKAQN